MAELPALETIAVRLAIIGGALVAWFLTQRLIGLRPTSGDGIGDRLHDLTAGANQWLHRHPRAADRLLVASSLGVDVVTLFVLGYAVLGPDFAPFWGLLCLFVLRQASQAAVSAAGAAGDHLARSRDFRRFSSPMLSATTSSFPAIPRWRCTARYSWRRSACRR